jgi:vacuolar-type H+-ATPase subunit H
MASDVVEKVKAAEEKADSIISTSKEEAKRLLAEAQQQAVNRRKEFEKKLRSDNDAAVREAEKKAERLEESAKVGADEQCGKLRDVLASNKDKAVKLVIDEVLK